MNVRPQVSLAHQDKRSATEWTAQATDNSRRPPHHHPHQPPPLAPADDRLHRRRRQDGKTVIGCYPVDEAPEPCHLLELLATDSPGFDIGAITQEDPTGPREN
jgi:hypothetical protein